MVSADTAELRERLYGQSKPSAFYLTGEDNLRLTAFNSAAGVELAVRTRLLTCEGEIVVGAERLVPATDRSASSLWMNAGEGWLLGAEVHAGSGTPRVGQCFVVLEVVRGTDAAPLPLHALVQGYATATARLSYPGSPLRSSIDGPGVIRSIAGTDPAANTEISEAVPTNARWRLLGLDAALVTSAFVANREVVLTIDDGATVVAEVAAGVAQAASVTRRYSFARGVPRLAPAASTVISAPAPDIVLGAGFRIRTVTANLDAGDNFGAPQLLVEEWIED